MELSNTFDVPRPLDDAWPLLLDVERIAPCLPGAQLEETVDDEYRGVVKVKIGPITAQYKGAATFLERDDEAHTVVINGKGRDSRGAGSVEAVITARLEAISGDSTRVSVDTDLQIKGKVAQFGRGMMAEVSASLMDEFAANLGALLTEETAGAAAPGTETAAPKAASDAAPPAAARAESVDLVAHGVGPVARRIAVVAGIVVVLLVLRRIGGRSSTGAPDPDN